MQNHTKTNKNFENINKAKAPKNSYHQAMPTINYENCFSLSLEKFYKLLPKELYNYHDIEHDATQPLNIAKQLLQAKSSNFAYSFYQHNKIQPLDITKELLQASSFTDNIHKHDTIQSYDDIAKQLLQISSFTYGINQHDDAKTNNKLTNEEQKMRYKMNQALTIKGLDILSKVLPPILLSITQKPSLPLHKSVCYSYGISEVTDLKNWDIVNVGLMHYFFTANINTTMKLLVQPPFGIQQQFYASFARTFTTKFGSITPLYIQKYLMNGETPASIFTSNLISSIFFASSVVLMQNIENHYAIQNYTSFRQAVFSALCELQSANGKQAFIKGCMKNTLVYFAAYFITNELGYLYEQYLNSQFKPNHNQLQNNSPLIPEKKEYSCTKGIITNEYNTPNPDGTDSHFFGIHPYPEETFTRLERISIERENQNTKEQQHQNKNLIAHDTNSFADQYQDKHLFGVDTQKRNEISRTYREYQTEQREKEVLKEKINSNTNKFYFKEEQEKSRFYSLSNDYFTTFNNKFENKNAFLIIKNKQDHRHELNTDLNTPKHK